MKHTAFVLTLAQHEEPQHGGNSPGWLSSKEAQLGMVAVILFAYLALAVRLRKPAQQRAIEHMKKVETQNEEMLALLREIKSKLDRSAP